MFTKLIKSSDVAAILGISKALAYRLLAEGKIPSVRFGRTVRVRSEDIEKFISDCLTKKEIESDSNFQLEK